MNLLFQEIKSYVKLKSDKGISYRELTNFIAEKLIAYGETENIDSKAYTLSVSFLNRLSAYNSYEFSKDIGYEWLVYQGTLITTSREFCVAMVKKKFIHISEFSKVIKGDFKEFKEINGRIRNSTGLADGLCKNTNEKNFRILRGGPQCNHQLLPTSEDMVPDDVKEIVYNSLEYKIYKGQLTTEN